MQRKLLVLAALLAFAGGLLTTVHSEERFDYKVRQNFFLGMSGNAKAFAAGMQTCEEILATNPKHAEALVWHGAGLFFQSGQMFRDGDVQKGMQTFERGVREMDEAVALAPENLAVRIPRGAVLLTGTRFMGANERSKPLLERGVSDYQVALEQQKDVLGSLSEHQKGELLFGLAEGYSRLGQEDRARPLFERISQELAGTPYGERARTWFAKKPFSPEQMRCVGCHVK